MSPDPRQALCYQCHAPRAGMASGSGDDRTCQGIHEGIGCLACHAGHTMETRASCANRHPEGVPPRHWKSLANQTGD